MAGPIYSSNDSMDKSHDSRAVGSADRTWPAQGRDGLEAAGRRVQSIVHGTQAHIASSRMRVGEVVVLVVVQLWPRSELGLGVRRPLALHDREVRSSNLWIRCFSAAILEPNRRVSGV